MIDLEKLTRRSPIHDVLATCNPEWGEIADAPVAIRFQSTESELKVSQTLALCDVSALVKRGVKGSDTENLLAEAGIELGGPTTGLDVATDESSPSSSVDSSEQSDSS